MSQLQILYFKNKNWTVGSGKNFFYLKTSGNIFSSSKHVGIYTSLCMKHWYVFHKEICLVCSWIDMDLSHYTVTHTLVKHWNEIVSFWAF